MDTFLKKIALFILCISVFSAIKGQTINQIGFYEVNGTFAITTKPNYLFIGGGAVVDISNPVLPALINNGNISGMVTSVLVDGDYGYYGTGMNVKFVIADVSNPANPVNKGNVLFPHLNNLICGIAKKNEVVYLTAGTGGVYSVDVSDKMNPKILDSIPVSSSNQVRDIMIKDSIAFVAAGDGLEIININVPSKLKLLTTISAYYMSIDIQGNLAFLGKGNGGVDVYNISNPTKPSLAFSIPNSGGTAWDIKVKNNLLYLSTDIQGLFIYKIQNNSAVKMAQFHDATNGQCFSVALQDDLILLAGLVKGVAVLKYDSLGIATSIPDETQLAAINIFPNPAMSYFEVNKSDNNTGELEVRNMVGQLVLKEACKDARTHVDISELAKGDYIITYRDKEHLLNKKLVKIE
jgi:hypothetical protein